MRRFLMVAVIALIATMPVLATGQTESSGSASTSEYTDLAPGEVFGLGSERLEFSWWRNYDWAGDGTWPRSKGEEWIVENLDVHLELPGANGAATQQFSFMIVEDDYYDVIQLDRGQDVERLVAAGKLVPMDDWIMKYPNLVNEVGMDVINMLRSSDGHFYQFPNWPIGPDRLNGNAGWFVNADIYNELGRPPLEDFDDFETYLAEVKKNYPNVVPFEVGTQFVGWDIMYTGFDNFLDGSFMRQYYAEPDDDELVFITDSEAFRKSALMVSRLFRAGLITQDGFTQTRDQMREKLNAQRVAVMAFGDAAGEADTARAAIRKNIDPDAEPYEFIHPITDGIPLDEFRHSARNRLGWNVNVITVDAGERAEKIFAFMDWMFGPFGSMVGRMGPPNLYWDADSWDPKADRFPPIKEEWFSATAEDLVDLGHMRWVGNTSYADQLGEILNDEQPNPELKNWKQSVFSTYVWRYSFDGTEFSNLVPPGDSEEGIIYATVKDIMDEYYAQIVFAESDAEVLGLLDAAKADAMSAGYNQVIDYMTEVWEENKTKLGI